MSTTKKTKRKPSTVLSLREYNAYFGPGGPGNFGPKVTPPAQGRKSKPPADFEPLRDVFSYSWSTIGRLLGCTDEEAQVRGRPLFRYEGKPKRKVLVRGPLFDPKDLKSVFEYWKSECAKLEEQGSKLTRPWTPEKVAELSRSGEIDARAHNESHRPHFRHDVKPGSTPVPFNLQKAVRSLNEKTLAFHAEARAKGVDPTLLLKIAELRCKDCKDE